MEAIQKNSFRQRFSITRRKLLGSMFVGAGTLADRVPDEIHR